MNYMKPTIAYIIARLAKKHPLNYDISATESTHCVLGHTIYAWVELESQKIMYATDKAYKLRVVSVEELTPTYKSIRLQPKDSVVMIRGGQYDGKYVTAYEGDGWLKTGGIPDIPMKAAYAKEFRDYVAHHAQYCYRGTFEVVII
jgi:C-terminal processing protease CtpA/Prc